MNVSPQAKALGERISEEAKRKADGVIQSARKLAEEVEASAIKNSEARKRRIVDSAKAEIDRIKGDELARIRTQYRTKLYSLQWELIDDVFSKALDILEKSREREDYPKVMERLVTESIRAIDGDKVIVHVDPKDAEIVGGIVKGIQDKKVVVEPDKDTIGGAMATTADGMIEVDNMLEAKFKLKAQETREKVWKLLYGELGQ